MSKAFYGLKQAPRNNFSRGSIDNTLFIKKDKGHVILVQIYVDDIIFGSTNESLYKWFSNLMSKQYQMSMIGEMTYFHGLQVHHKSVDIFIKQSKYVHDLLKKYSFEHCSSMSTPMNVFDKFHKDEFGKPMCQTTYRGMIDSLL